MTSFKLLGLFAETHIHAGEGQRYSAVDRPISREQTTHYPYIAGSSLKGALRAQYPDTDFAAKTRLFGYNRDEDTAPIDLNDANKETAGALIISDARLLLLPVRSNYGPCFHVTCPALLRRFEQDRARGGETTARMIAAKLLSYEGDAVLVSSGIGKLELEELEFQQSECPDLLGTIADALRLLGIGDDQINLSRLAVVSDEAFTWLSATATPVRARNSLDRDTKTATKGLLWYDETLASETVMTMMVGDRVDGASATYLKEISHLANGSRHYFQVGGNETVGQGWVSFRKETDQSGMSS